MRARGNSVRSRRQGGLTLIELMVSILLASILLGGLFFMASGQQKTYTTQVGVLTAQENLWGAMEYLEHELRMAGFGMAMCSGTTISNCGDMGDAGATAGMSFEALTIKNDYNYLTGGSDGTGTDSFRVQRGEADFGGDSIVTITDPWHPVSSSVMYVSGEASIKTGSQLLLCAPGLPNVLIQATKFEEASSKDYNGDGKADWKLEHNQGGSDPCPNDPSRRINNSNMKKLFEDYGTPANQYPSGAMIVNFGGVGLGRTFAVDNARNPPRLVTWTQEDSSGNPTDLEIVAMGVEDMQVSYACDTDDDGVLAEGADASGKQSDEWAFNVAGDAPPDCSNLPIRRVRVTLIARTASPVMNEKNNFRPEAEDHAAGDPTTEFNNTGQMGTYPRALLTSVVKPRNIEVITTSPTGP